MKRLMRWTCVLALLLVAVGCQKDEFKQQITKPVIEDELTLRGTEGSIVDHLPETLNYTVEYGVGDTDVEITWYLKSPTHRVLLHNYLFIKTIYIPATIQVPPVIPIYLENAGDSYILTVRIDGNAEPGDYANVLSVYYVAIEKLTGQEFPNRFEAEEFYLTITTNPSWLEDQLEELIENGEVTFDNEGHEKSVNNKIEQAIDAYNRGDLETACDKLLWLYLRSDGNPEPPDQIQGEGAATFNKYVLDLMEELGCGFTNTETDPRDGQKYQWVLLDDGNWWMAENLNYEMEGSWCYDDDPANCEIYGRLYDWYAAVQACPPGSHLATKTEWDKMIGYYGGIFSNEVYYNLVAPEFNGNGSSGFNALLGGVRGLYGGYYYLGANGYYQSATEDGVYKAWYYTFSDSYGAIFRGVNTKLSGRSCRCLKG